MNNIPDMSRCVIDDLNENMLQENQKPIYKNFLSAGSTEHTKNQSETVVLCCTRHIPNISGY